MVKKSRNTRQKEILSSEVLKINSFFTSEDLYAKVRSKDKKIGIATVYRFLVEQVKKQKLHSYTCNRKTIYSTDNKSHSHFSCELCGKIEHLKIHSIDSLKKEIKGSICHFQIDVSGICETCQKKK